HPGEAYCSADRRLIEGVSGVAEGVDRHEAELLHDVPFLEPGFFRGRTRRDFFDDIAPIDFEAKAEVIRQRIAIDHIAGLVAVGNELAIQALLDLVAMQALAAAR